MSPEPLPLTGVCLPLDRTMILKATSNALHIIGIHPAPGEEPWAQIRELYAIVTEATKMLGELRQVEREHIGRALGVLLSAREEIEAAWIAGAPQGRFQTIDGRCLAVDMRELPAVGG